MAPLNQYEIAILGGHAKRQTTDGYVFDTRNDSVRSVLNHTMEFVTEANPCIVIGHD